MRANLDTAARKINALLTGRIGETTLAARSAYGSHREERQ
jgi:hypothetical protein